VWRTVLFLIPVVAVYTIVLGTLSVFSSLLERRGYFAHGCARLWSWLILATAGVRVRLAGLEQLQPGATYVFVANHQSIFDIPIVFASLPFQLRIAAKASLGGFPFIGWHLRRTGHLLVDRRSPGTTLFGRAAALVRDGLSMIVFPEGTRSVDGTVARFKGGIFLVAIQAGLPVVPVSIAGSRHVMKKGKLAVRPGRVSLIVHAPIETKGLSTDEAKALAARVRRVVESGIAE
jgi:1-acyl-sn-glycerol-3-phosphate acyltransferase